MAELPERLILFLGAGTSQCSEMPDTGKLTELVLAGPDSWPGSTPRNTGCPSSEQDNCKKERQFLSLLKNRLDSFLQKNPGREANYEDLYYVTETCFHLGNQR